MQDIEIPECDSDGCRDGDEQFAGPLHGMVVRQTKVDAPQQADAVVPDRPETDQAGNRHGEGAGIRPVPPITVGTAMSWPIAPPLGVDGTPLSAGIWLR